MLILDLSKHQGRVNWDALRPHAIILRASVGRGVDEQWDRNWREARARCAIVGAYHYYRHGVPVDEQVEAYRMAMPPGALLDEGVLPPILDVEIAPSDDPYPNPLTDADFPGIKTWIDCIHRDAQAKPWIYTSIGTWPLTESHTRALACPLWVADYSRTPPRLPAGWDKWLLHQYSSTGRADGVATPVDCNRFEGTEAELDALARRQMGPYR